MTTSVQEQEQIGELFPSAAEFHESLGGRLAYLYIGDEKCTSCGKRRSPSSFSSSEPQHPKSKKPMLQLQSHHDHSQQEQETNPFHGFTKIPLPFPVLTTAAAAKTDLSSASSSPPIPELRRSVSDPFVSPGLNEFSSGGSAPAPLRRSVSDPFNSPGAVSDLTKSKNDSPPPTSAARSLPPLHPRSTGSQIMRQLKKIPNSSRLKRMKERMREMSQWWDEIIQEDEEEEELVEPEEDDDNNSTISRQDVSGTEGEEEVKVETVKDGFNIKFACPCGKGYHMLVCGKNCYYKLM